VSYLGRPSERATLSPPGPTTVVLVGAGPGDPELLTVRAVNRLAEAEVVMYDALVDARLLALAPQALHVPVGRRAGRGGPDFDDVCARLIVAAQAGIRVVRLKCGDPFVFGRGGEEALALQQAGVPFEIVPGLSNALAAPALASIPVTHRGLASGLLVVSGHDGALLERLLPERYLADVSIVVLMGLRTRAQLVTLLTERGAALDTPAALVLGAGTDRQWTWSGSLEGLAVVTLPQGELPGTIVIGRVASLGPQLTATAILERRAEPTRRVDPGRSPARLPARGLQLEVRS